jgi:nucleoside-diphosphate-sugar epimerase
LHQFRIQGIQTLLKKIHYRTYNIFLAAKKSGVKRVIYASSIHAISGYSKDIQVKTTDPVNPGDLYGMKFSDS